MRITGGELSGRIISQPTSGKTRPMSEKLRAAIFDILGSVEGLTLLDAYAGSGAVGFEALSRGCRQVVAIEQAASVAGTVRANALQLAVGDKFRLVVSSVETWTKDNQTMAFDIIVADPPYAQIQRSILEALSSSIAPSGILIVSHTSKLTMPELQSLSLIKTKTYGDSALSFYRLTK